MLEAKREINRGWILNRCVFAVSVGNFLADKLAMNLRVTLAPFGKCVPKLFRLPQTAMNTAKKTVAPLSKRWVT